MYTMKDLAPSLSLTNCLCKAESESEAIRHLELERCVHWIQEQKATKVCLQFPPELLHLSSHVGHIMEEELNQKIYILGDTSYGSCCADEVSAQHLNSDAIIHFGNACLSRSIRIPILYIFPKHSIDIPAFVSVFKEKFSSNDCLLLLYDVSYLHAIHDIKASLEKTHKKVVISTLTTGTATSHEPHLLGRRFQLDHRTPKDLKVIFIGNDGPTAANFKHSMPEAQFFLYNPMEKNSIDSYENNVNRFLRKRMFLIETLKQAQNLGIIVGTLCVESYLQAIERIKELAKSRGVRCYIFAVGKLTVAKLANFPQMDAFVLISCPENTLIDSKDFFRPIVTPYEVELAFNSTYKWSEKFVVDFTTLLPGRINYVPGDSSVVCSETNVSLVGGLAGKEASASTSADIIEHDTGSIVSYNTQGSNYLTTRSWSGLQPELENIEVHTALKGRKGIPEKYENEH